MDAIVHYDNRTGLVESPGLYLQFDDPSDTRISYTEGVSGKLRRYSITKQQIIDSGLTIGKWNPSVRLGDVEDPQDGDSIEYAFSYEWGGASEITNVSGGGILSARIGIVSLTSSDFLEVVQGESKVITFIVEALGRFVQEIFDTITVKFKDTAGTLITKTEDDSIERVCQALDVQVIRCTLSDVDTASLVAGLLQIEIAFDNQKARLTHTLKILDQIT